MPTLAACVGEHAAPPFSYPDHDGATQTLLRAAVGKLGGTVEFVVEPRKRCLLDVQSGKYPILLLLGGAHSVMNKFAFPLRQGALDAARSIGHAEFLFVRRVGTLASWDGQRVTGINSPLILPAGYLLVKSLLDEFGIAAKDAPLGAEQAIRMLMRGHADLALIRDVDWEYFQQSSEFRGKLERLEQSFARLDLYTVFNVEFAKRHEALTQAIWNEMAQLQTSGVRHSKVP